MVYQTHNKTGLMKVMKYNPSNGRMYLTIDEFRAKVQPYLVDMCMQLN